MKITNKLSFISSSILNRWNNNACTNNCVKNPDNVREPNAPARRLKPKLYNTVKSETLSVREFKYIITVIYTVLEI